MKAKKVRAVFQLQVRLRDIEPAIWRRIHVWEDVKLPQLHRVFQMLFNWEDYHLHDFVVGRRVYSVPDPDDDLNERKVIDEKGVPLSRIVDRVGDTFVYSYDFGDDWQHDVLLEAILLPEPGAFYPRCIAGARNGPPEDAGGPYGYARYLEALSDPDHEEHAELLAWRGPFDPEEFPLDRINASLKRSFYRRPAAKPALPAVEPNPEMDHLAQFIRAALQGGIPPDIPKTRIAPGSTLPLELTDRERDLILKQSFAEEDLTRRLRLVSPPGQSTVVRYTLDELDDLAGYVAAESNHAKDPKLHKLWEAIYVKIAALLESYTDGQE
ncbi:MAG: plasmid pRiA4b ORF-3 family protein [Bryobacterales bacterium]|nr:plasmid pRiA4b ORF-3 family protein [Bryobacterales bacterium]